MAHNGALDKWYLLCRVYLWHTTERWTSGIYYEGLLMAHNGALDKWYILYRVTYSTQRNAGQVVYTM